jgi:hypothetical protein
MGFIDDKSNLIKEIGIFKTINDLPNSKAVSSFNDIKSAKKNILPFLLNMLAMSCEDKEEVPKPEFDPTFSGPPPKGTLLEATGGNKVKCNAIRILLEILIEFLPELVRIVKEAIVVAIRESLSCSSDFVIPANTVQVIDLETIDYNNILKTDPDSNILGGIFYGTSDKDFNRFLYNLIQTPGIPQIWVGPNGPMMDITFVLPGQLIISINPNYDENSGKTFNDFISDYMASIDLFDNKILIGNLMDSFFSNITANLDFSLEQLVSEEKTNKLIDKILDTDPCYDEIIFDDSFFTFSNDEVAEFEYRSKQRKEGIVNIDLGCGVYPLDIRDDNAKLGALLDILDSSGNDPKLQEDTTKKIVNVMQDNATEGQEDNKESIKNKLQVDFVLSIPKVIMKTSVLTPKILGIYNFSNFIVNNTTITERNSYDWSKNNRVFLEYVARESLAVLLKIVFNRLKIELMRLISRVIQKILKSIVNKKLAIIASFALPLASGAVNGLINRIPQPEVEGSKYK